MLVVLVATLVVEGGGSPISWFDAIAAVLGAVVRAVVAGESPDTPKREIS